MDNIKHYIKSKWLIIFEIFCILIIIGIIGYTYSFFTATVTDSVTIRGEAASMNLNLTVTKLAPNNTKGLIPQLDDYITNAVIGRNGSCIDDNNNNVCQVYKITLKNNSAVTVYVNGTLTLNAKNNPNLKWAMISGTTNPTLTSSINSHTFVTLTENELYNANQQKDYYIVLWISETGGLQTDNGIFNGVVKFEDTDTTTNTPPAKQTLTSLELDSQINETVLTSFTNTSKNDNSTGIYASEDDLGTSYYFRGNITNNYVKFAGYYWRIIRINGDGSLRVIYDGTSAHTNSDASTDRQIGRSVYNTNSNDNAYVGYMYGTAGSTTYEATHTNTNNSTIKTYIDTWYNTNIKNTPNASYVVDAIYCNDRTRVTDTTKMAELDGYWEFTSTGEGFGTKLTYYGILNRTLGDFTTVTPSLKCPETRDKFTVSNTLGNGKLDNPIGLITFDEMIFGGSYMHMGGTYQNNETYLYNGINGYWAMSPITFYDEYAGVVCGELGAISSDNVGFADYGARPVISLLSSGITDGNGTASAPFIIGSE